jgi:epoxyqueuosine reductase
MNSNIHIHTQMIKTKALELGFMFCGISKAGFLEQEAPRLEKWLNQNMHGEMAYMENHFDKRLDPTLLVDGAKSVISLALNYFPEKTNSQPIGLKVSKYAYGKDYHYVIKEKLKELLKFMNEQIGEIGGRAFVDSAPVLDKAWAKKSGLGWVGKNANIINKERGSFFFIAELIVDIALTEDGPVKDYCGTCTKCIDACPTDAIVAPYVVNGSKCISYYTIELKNAIPDDAKGKFNDWMFGCDICQDVCPWNRFSKPHQEPLFEPIPQLLSFSLKDWEEITEEAFNKVFKESPLKRAKFQGIKKNIQFLKS